MSDCSSSVFLQSHRKKRDGAPEVQAESNAVLKSKGSWQPETTALRQCMTSQTGVGKGLLPGRERIGDLAHAAHLQTAPGIQ